VIGAKAQRGGGLRAGEVDVRLAGSNRRTALLLCPTARSADLEGNREN